MQTDAELLTLYIEGESEQAFTALVQRHLPLAYSAALRQLGGDHHRAQEVVQNVFTLFARKAHGLRHHPAIIGWLYATTHYTAAKMRRAEQRRKRLEEQAVTEGEPTSGIEWEQMRPVIDGCMLQLKERDRTAVLLRFFANHSYSEVGRQLGLSENAARMRVDRALDSIRSALARRGIASTSAALGTLLATQVVGAVPEGLVTTVSASAVSAGAGGGIFVFMSSTLVKVGVVVGVLAAGSAGVFIHHRSNEENALLRTELSEMKRQLAEQNAPKNLARPAHGEAIVSVQPQPPNTAGANVAQRYEAQVNRGVGTGRILLHDFQNQGRTTPAAALQTVLWAIAHGDETLPDMLFLNKPALKATQELMVSLPENAKVGYDTPEKLAALYLSKYVIEQVDAAQVLEATQVDQDTAEVKVMMGGSPTIVSMQQTPAGWLWKVKASLIERAKSELLGPDATSAISR